MSMKYVIILPDGAADEPVEQLGGRTPLQAARKPNIDWVAQSGRQGCVVTIPQGFAPGSDVATLSLLGYDPRLYHSGRAPLEAAAQGLPVAPDQVVFRCNFVTIVDGKMEDFTAGHIRSTESAELVAYLNEHLRDTGCHFHPGVSYRNLMTASDTGNLDPRCTPPHDIPLQLVSRHLPQGKGAEWTIKIMDRARAVLAGHNVNQVRRDLGENPATDIWLWGQGHPRPMDSFATRFGLRGACIAAVDLIRGIARTIGMEVIDVAGATGYLDTDYAAKGRAGAAALDSFDLVIVHIEAPDEAGHQGDAIAKTTAIERIDEAIVGPLLEKLRSFEKWRILVAPDHPTPVARRVHTSDPPPFCMAGYGVSAVVQRPFSEEAARNSDLHIDPGHELMEFFLRSM